MQPQVPKPLPTVLCREYATDHQAASTFSVWKSIPCGARTRDLEPRGSVTRPLATPWPAEKVNIKSATYRKVSAFSAPGRLRVCVHEDVNGRTGWLKDAVWRSWLWLVRHCIICYRLLLWQESCFIQVCVGTIWFTMLHHTWPHFLAAGTPKRACGNLSCCTNCSEWYHEKCHSIPETVFTEGSLPALCLIYYNMFEYIHSLLLHF